VIRGWLWAVYDQFFRFSRGGRRPRHVEQTRREVYKSKRFGNDYREYWNPVAFTAAMAGTRFDNSAK
jgi:hypothetical protein